MTEMRGAADRLNRGFVGVAHVGMRRGPRLRGQDLCRPHEANVADGLPEEAAVLIVHLGRASRHVFILREARGEVATAP